MEISYDTSCGYACGYDDGNEASSGGECISGGIYVDRCGTLWGADVVGDDLSKPQCFIVAI